MLDLFIPIYEKINFLFKNKFAISGQSTCLTAVKQFMTGLYQYVLSLSEPTYASFLLNQQSLERCLLITAMLYQYGDFTSQ